MSGGENKTRRGSKRRAKSWLYGACGWSFTLSSKRAFERVDDVEQGVVGGVCPVHVRDAHAAVHQMVITVIVHKKEQRSRGAHSEPSSDEELQCTHVHVKRYEQFHVRSWCVAIAHFDRWVFVVPAQVGVLVALYDDRGAHWKAFARLRSDTRSLGERRLVLKCNRDALARQYHLRHRDGLVTVPATQQI